MFFGFVVAAGTAAVTLLALAAIGKTNGYENVVLVTLATSLFTYAAAFGITRRRRVALIASAVFTLIVVSGGFALLYFLFESLCGSDSSAC